MTRRIMITLIVVLAALLAGAPAALAGGWVVVTLDQLPQGIRAEESIQIGFVIHQHGQTLVNNDWDGNPLEPTLTIKQAGDPNAHQFTARQQGSTGHFVADVRFPRAGEWEWSIAVPPFMIASATGNRAALQLEPISVLPAVAAPLPVAPAPAPRALAWMGLLLVAALAVWFARQRRPGHATE